MFDYLNLQAIEDTLTSYLFGEIDEDTFAEIFGVPKPVLVNVAPLKIKYGGLSDQDKKKIYRQDLEYGIIGYNTVFISRQIKWYQENYGEK